MKKFIIFAVLLIYIGVPNKDINATGFELISPLRYGLMALNEGGFNFIIMKEIWKPIKNYERYYEISNLGNIRSVDRYVNHYSGSKRLMKGKSRCFGNNGHDYSFIPLTKYGKSKNYYVHRLVAEAFVEKKGNRKHVNHLDGNKQNNKSPNLEWVTIQENWDHAKKIGLTNTGEKHGLTKLTNIDAINIRKFYLGSVTQKELSKMFFCSEVAIWRIVNNLSFTK